MTVHWRAMAVAAGVGLVWVAGCKDEPAAVPTTTPVASTQTIPSSLLRQQVPDAEIIGAWRVASVRGSELRPVPLDTAETVRQTTYDIRPDHTFSQRSAGGGGRRGTWEIRGDSLFLRNDDTGGGLVELTIEGASGNRTLVDRPVKDVTISYTLSTSGPGVSRLTTLADQLLEEVARNPVDAKAKYDRMTIEVAGLVNQVYGDPEPFVTIYGPSEKGMASVGLLGGVACFVNMPQPWASLANGQRVKIRGEVAIDILPATKLPDLPSSELPTTGPAISAAVGRVRLQDAVIVEKGPSTAITGAAADLARAFSAAGVTTTPAVLRHYLVAGKVLTVQGNTATVGAPDAAFTCRFSKRAAESLKVGADVTVFGELDSKASVAANAYVLDQCLLVNK